MTFPLHVLPNPEVNAVPVRTPYHLSNQPFRSGRRHASAQSHASSTLAAMRSVESSFRRGADGIFGRPNLASAGKARMSLSGSIDIAFSQKEEKHHWKCPRNPPNFFVWPF